MPLLILSIKQLMSSLAHLLRKEFRHNLKEKERVFDHKLTYYVM